MTRQSFTKCNFLKNEMNSLSFIVGNKKALQSKHISRHCKRSKKGKETNTSIVLSNGYMFS